MTDRELQSMALDMQNETNPDARKPLKDALPELLTGIQDEIQKASNDIVTAQNRLNNYKDFEARIVRMMRQQ